MGFIKKLGDFNRKVDQIEQTKTSLEKGLNKNKRDEDEIKDIKKSNIWSTINLVLVVAFAVAVPFIVKAAFAEGGASAALIIIVLLGCLGGLYTSLGKAYHFMRNEVVGYGAKLYGYFVFILSFVGVFADVIVFVLLI